MAGNYPARNDAWNWDDRTLCQLIKNVDLAFHNIQIALGSNTGADTLLRKGHLVNWKLAVRYKYFSKIWSGSFVENFQVSLMVPKSLQKVGISAGSDALKPDGQFPLNGCTNGGNF